MLKKRRKAKIDAENAEMYTNTEKLGFIETKPGEVYRFEDEILPAKKLIILSLIEEEEKSGAIDEEAKDEISEIYEDGIPTSADLKLKKSKQVLTG